MKKVTLLFIVLFCFQISKASHLNGGQISYEHVSGNNYIVKLHLLSSCNGIILNSFPLAAISASSNQNIADTLVLKSTIYSGQTCQFVGPCDLIMSEYEAMVSLPNVAADWKFATSVNARNFSQSFNSGALYLEATLDNTIQTPNNTARVPSFKPLTFHQLNVLQNIDLNVVDPDGDSLSYSLISARGGFVTAPVPLSYLNSLSATQPLNSLTPITLNPTSGVLSFTPSVTGQYVFAIQIDEYRSGNLIASSVYDSEVVIVQDTTISNLNPTIVGANPQNVVTVNACPNSPLNINLNTADMNVSDSTFIAWDSSIVGANFTITPGLNENGLFTWSPDTSHVRPAPYLVSFRVTDNNCNLLGDNIYTYLIYVNQCSPDSVWAGDANADFTCDNYDVLNIGIANGSTGALRPGATTTWQAEWCPNWATTFINNIDYKHADCNGDGTVNSADLAAVTANYGLIHQKTNNVGQYKTLGLPDLYCDLQNVQAHKGSTISIPVMLGTTGSEMNDFYGISATVELLNAQTSAPISVSKNVSWIGNATNSFDFEKNLAPNKSAFTFVRNDQQNLMNQQGQIGEITFPIDASSVIGSQVTVQFSDIKVIKNDGEEINDYNVLNNSFEILAPLGVQDYDKGFAANVYPNPNTGEFTLSLTVEKQTDFQVSLSDATGRKLEGNTARLSFVKGNHSIAIDMTEKATGQYFLELITEGGKKVIPIQKW